MGLHDETRDPAAPAARADLLPMRRRAARLRPVPLAAGAPILYPSPPIDRPAEQRGLSTRFQSGARRKGSGPGGGGLSCRRAAPPGGSDFLASPIHPGLPAFRPVQQALARREGPLVLPQPLWRRDGLCPAGLHRHAELLLVTPRSRVTL